MRRLAPGRFGRSAETKKLSPYPPPGCREDLFRHRPGLAAFQPVGAKEFHGFPVSESRAKLRSRRRDIGLHGSERRYPRRWGFMNRSQASRTACRPASSAGGAPPMLPRVCVVSLKMPRTTIR